MHLPIPTGGDVWQALQETDRPIAIYGTGNGADKLLDVFAERNIPVAAVFASDGFVRNRTFRTFPVLSYRETAERFPGHIVAVAFASSREEVLANIEQIGAERMLVMPPLPVYADSLMDELFDRTYYERHRDALKTVRGLLADEDSRRCFDDVIAYRLSGDVSYLRDAVWTEEEIWSLLSPERFTLCADLGAYNGDTIGSLWAHTTGKPHVIALEPDKRTFQKLIANCPEAECYEMAAWDEETVLSFTAKSNRGSSRSASGKSVGVKATCLDRLLHGRPIDYIKYDVEGAEAHALRGSREAIARCRPTLLISLYHRTADLFTLPLLLRDICRDYSMYLRRTKGFPDWDLNLIAISKRT